MNANIVYLCGLLAGASPFLAIALILLHYLLRRSRWKIRQRRGHKYLGFCPSSAALGMALLFTQVFTRPSLRHVIEQKQEEREDENEDGLSDQQRRNRQVDSQLRRLRRGEPIEDLIWRL